MKTYQQLTNDQKVKAVHVMTNRILELLFRGQIIFSDKENHDDFQARVDAAIEKASNMGTPWFAAEMIMEDEFCNEQITDMAAENAQNFLYLEEGERAINLSLIDEVEL